MAAPAEWCEGDHELLVRARIEVLRHRRRQPVNPVGSDVDDTLPVRSQERIDT
jgi:hypothetical protein